MTSTNDLRREFLEYFEKKGHTRVASEPLTVVPPRFRGSSYRLIPL